MPDGIRKQVTVQEKVVCIVHGGTIMALLTVMDRVPILTISAGADRDTNVRCPMQ